MQTEASGDIKKAMQDHVSQFANPESLPDYISADIRVHTPIADFKGPSGLKRFYEILQEYLPKATISITSVDYLKDKVVYSWKAFSPTASVRNGRCSAYFKDGKIIEQCIECLVEPEVQNQG